MKTTASDRLTMLALRLRSLAVFRALLDDAVVRALCCYLDCRLNAGLSEAVSAYAAFAAQLYASGAGSLAQYIQGVVNDNENVYIRTVGAGRQPAAELELAVQEELRTLQEVADLTPAQLREGLDWDGFLPSFATAQLDLAAEYARRSADVARYGYGIYARYHMFYLDPHNNIVPVHNPDPIRLSSLIDYKREQQIILDNTVALLEGKPAANILLSGDAGTGKSSTVKAVVNELYQRGLRILEVRKEQLHQIPAILDELNSNPLKFIIFIDDLSFQRDDDNYSALKAILEGSVAAKAQNVVIYATSNRRHLVKESFAGRDGDDVHRNETMQEIISLSERFGLQISFYKPDKQTYLDIVRHLAAERGLELGAAELELKAERFALSRGGRSARAATQFVDSLLTMQKK